MVRINVCHALDVSSILASSAKLTENPPSRQLA
jgi:hypothetical protein